MGAWHWILTLDAASITVHDDGLQELVVLALLISFLDSGDRVTALLTLTKNQTLEGELDSLPPLVTVHGVVTTDNGGQLADTELLDGVQQLLQIAGARLGVGVTAIAEEVDVDLGNLVLLGGLEESIQVLLLRVLIERVLSAA